jgi:peptide/nickel transport system substrate-binding protein
MTIKTTKTTPGLVLDRREVMKGAAALGLGFGALATFGGTALATDTPRKGGTFRLGLEGGSASDSLDPRSFADSIPFNYGYQIWNGLIEVDAQGNLVGELLENWESKPGAVEWIFNIRKGVTFHSGKTLDADDIVYSINLHRGVTTSPAKDMLNAIVDVKKVSPTQIQITLAAGNINLPYSLTDFHIFGIPNGFTDFSKPDGTGAFRLERFQPGVRVVTKNAGNYWKEGRGNFDQVELIYIPDATSRLEALLAGQVDAINRVDPKTVEIVMASPDVKVVQSKGTGSRYAFAAHCDTAPYDNLDTRLALKYGIDRQKIVDIVYSGYATVGNDTTVGPTSPYFDKDLPQTAHDPEKALFHYKKAGSPKLELKVSDGVYTGATDAGVLLQESLKQAGIDLTLTRVSADGYWSNVWLKDPFCAIYWGVRPSIDMQLSQTYLSDAAWNDTHWKRPEFDKLVIEARVEEDEAKRREKYTQAQKMIHDDGGMICYAVADYLDGYSNKIAGVASHPRYDMCDARVSEKAWFVA